MHLLNGLKHSFRRINAFKNSRNLDGNISIWYTVQLSGKHFSNTQMKNNKLFESVAFEWIRWCCNRQTSDLYNTQWKEMRHIANSDGHQQRKLQSDLTTAAHNSTTVVVLTGLRVCTQELRNGSLIFASRTKGDAILFLLHHDWVSRENRLYYFRHCNTFFFFCSKFKEKQKQIAIKLSKKHIQNYIDHVIVNFLANFSWILTKYSNFEAIHFYIF